MVVSLVTDNLEVSHSVIKGNVMKRIEKESILQRQNFHQRFLKLEFGHPFCYFFKSSRDSQWHKSHKQVQILSCRVLSDEEIQEKYQEKQRARSSSMLRKMSATRATLCKWTFGFTLEFPEKTYELYSPTRRERDKWVEVLSAIAEMNMKSIRLEAMSPFDYIQERDNP